MISTRDLSLLPDIETLRQTWQSMAMVDAVLCPNWEYRYYSFQAGWGEGEQLGSMRSGSGDDLFAHFSSAGCWIKGFDHESPLSPFTEHPPRVRPGVLDHVPPEFAACLQEPAFNVDMATFCIWRRPVDAAWQTGPVAFPADAHDPDGPDPDGSVQMLSPLDGRAETYRAWAEEYYERKVDAAAVEQIFEHRPLTPELVAKLNPKASLAGLVDDIREIGYPVATE
jgi:hypothetical protein